MGNYAEVTYVLCIHSLKSWSAEPQFHQDLTGIRPWVAHRRIKNGGR
jgi:hypothetical protein